MHVAKPIDRLKLRLHVCRQISSPYVGKTESMLALLSWIEEKIFDLNSVTRILISLLKLRRKYIIIRCSVISSRESNLCKLATRWKTTENNINSHV